jgi:hypothetical protein
MRSAVNQFSKRMTQYTDGGVVPVETCRVSRDRGESLHGGDLDAAAANKATRRRTNVARSPVRRAGDWISDRDQLTAGREQQGRSGSHQYAPSMGDVHRV